MKTNLLVVFGSIHVFFRLYRNIKNRITVAFIHNFSRNFNLYYKTSKNIILDLGNNCSPKNENN